jgi:hypothetical protein
MLPSSPPPVRAYFEHREAKERDVARPLRWPAMTSPVLVAGRIAVALLEVEAGFRPGHQLERHCHPTLWDRLAPRLCFRGGPAITCRSLRRVLIQEHIPGLVDAVAVLERGRRVEAVAMRLDVATAQILTGELSAREVEDVDTATLSYAEVKALATGQPLLLEAATVAAGIARLRNHKLATSVPNAASARTSTSSSATPRAARSAPGRWRPWPSTPPAATRYSGRTVARPWPTAPPSPRPSPLRRPPRCSKVPANTWASGAGSASRSPHPGLGRQCPRGHRPGGLPARGVVRGPQELAAAGPAVAHPDQP